MKILVTGSTGFVGGHLIEKLLNEGHEVFALARNPKRLTLSAHNNLKVIQGDLDQDELSWVKTLPSDLDTCVHTAGIVHHYDTNEFYRVNTDGTEHLIINLKKSFANLHFVLISSLAAAGPSLSLEKRTEEDMDLPVSVYGRSKKQAEEVLKKLAPESYKISVIRPPMVIGPRDPAVLDVFKMVKSGVIVLPGFGSKEKLYSFVCVFDLVTTIVKVIELKKSSVYYSSHPQVVTFNELILEIKKQLKKKWIVYLPLPLFLVRIVTMILDFFYKLFPHSLRLTPDKYHEFAATNWTCDGKKSESELSQVYAYDLSRTITVTLIDYKSRKWI